MRQFILISFIILLYTQGIGTRNGIPGAIYNGLLFILPLGFLFLRNKRPVIPPGLFFVLLYLIWAILSSVYNGEGVLLGIMFSRYLIIGYLVLFATFNSYFSKNSLKRILKIIFFLFFVQIITAIIEILILERAESIVGTMTSGSGGLATTFPMFAFSLFFSAFLFLKKLKYLLIGISFMVIGYASGKLGIYFLIPSLAFIGYAFYLWIDKRPILNKQTLSMLIGFSLIMVLIVFVLPSADKRTENLNMSNLSLLERIDTFVSFAEKGESMVVDGYTISRSSTSERIIKETFKRAPDVFLFGHGFSAYQAMGQTLGKGAFEKYKIVYGITGWSYDALVIGWPGVLIHLLFFLSIFKKTLKIYRESTFNTLGKTLSFACLLNFFTFLINYFFYNFNFTVGGWVICMHLFFSGLILAPQYRALFIKNITSNE
ncbi:MAG: hypothetical protein JKX82_00575 [Oleispira sp.]|nr:hypothetical protein [Oleispira sp.]